MPSPQLKLSVVGDIETNLKEPRLGTSVWALLAGELNEMSQWRNHSILQALMRTIHYELL
jgi:hypothetical protein